MEFKGSRTEANLMAAFAGESQARNKYTYYASQAKKDGYMQIARIFEETAANESFHEQRYLKLRENIETGKVFKRGAGTVWICLNCGHLYTGETPPALCPVCKHPQSYFQLHIEDY